MREKRVIIPSWPLLAILFTLLVLWGAFLSSPFGKVTTIEVSGTHDLDATTLVKDMNIKPGISVVDLWLKEKSIESNVEASSPQVLAADFSYTKNIGWWLKVDEAKVLALWQNGDSYLPILKNGQTLEAVDPNEAPILPILITPNDWHANKTFLESLNNLDDAVRTNIVSMTLAEDSDEVSLTMSDQQVVIGISDTIMAKMADYPAMKKEIGNKEGILYLDEGAYFKESDQNETVPVTQDN